MAKESTLTLTLKVDDNGTVVLDKFTKNIKKAGDDVSKMTKAMEVVSVAAFINIGKQVLQVTEQIYSFGKSIASSLMDIERQAKIVGLSTDQFQKWTYAAKMSDVEAESLALGFKFLSRNMEAASLGAGKSEKYFKAMGISVKDDATGNLRPLDEVMKQVMDKFASWEDGPRKIAIAMALFGRSGQQLIPLLNQGRAGFEKFAAEAKKLGVILDPGLIKQGTEAEDIFKKIDAQINAMKSSLAPLILEFAKFINGILNFITSHKQDFMDAWRVIFWPYFMYQDIMAAWDKLGQKIGVMPKPGATWPAETRFSLPTKRVMTPGVESEEQEKARKRALEDYLKWMKEVEDWRSDIAKGMAEIQDQEGKVLLESFELQKVTLKSVSDQLESYDHALSVTADDLKQAGSITADFNKRIVEQEKHLAEVQHLVEGEQWEDYASGARDAADDMTRSMTVVQIFNEKSAEALRKVAGVVDSTIGSFGQNLSDAWSESVVNIIRGTESLKDAFKNLAQSMADSFISAISKMIAQWVLFGSLTGERGGWGAKTKTSWGGILGLIGGIFLQSGGSFWVNKPTPLMVGEGGEREFVSVTPESKMGPGGPRGPGGKTSIAAFYIYALDPLSFREYVKKNPEAILELINTDARAIGTMRGIVKNS